MTPPKSNNNKNNNNKKQKQMQYVQLSEVNNDNNEGKRTSHYASVIHLMPQCFQTVSNAIDVLLDNPFILLI